jgi:uncharacterized protein YbjT (DUF2867 family)
VKVLLAGASGFVGRYLYPALVAAGHEVLCGSRDPDSARARQPDRRWVRLDVADRKTVEASLEGCQGAYYLVHGMADGADYPEREAHSATSFAAAAEARSLERIVYLGGVLPAGQRPSRHLRSRQRTGELLRAGAVPTIELRAAMIVGAGSASWTMVRDLSARLPAMILPRWLRNHSYPIGIDDVVRALVVALELPREGSSVLELPGPERMTHRELLQRVAGVLGRQRVMVNVPVLTPRLSSYWIALVTRVDRHLAQELVEGLRYDLDPQGENFWEHTEHQPMALEEAARLALQDELNDPAHPGNAAARADRIGSMLRIGAT